MILKKNDSVYGESTIYTFIKSFFTPFLRPAFLKTVPSIIYNFFLRQYHAAFFKDRIPVTKVDHILDEKIPFVPSWITIYIDFVQFWIRMLGFFLRRYGRKAYKPVKDFILSMGDLYAFAAEVYTKNLSTTKRPFYIARPRFLMIHALDPHLMCIPSLHVMIVIHGFTQFSEIAKMLGEEENLKEQAIEMKKGALAITQAILFVKQHSVNCIPAALYAMTCYSPELFTPEEAKKFVSLLFSPAPTCHESLRKNRVHPAASPSTKIREEDQVEIKNHILSLYNLFLSQRDTLRPWYEPLLKFLKEYKEKE
jgi:hypothetical protein